MIVPCFKVSKERFYLQFLNVFNMFKFRLSDNGLLLLSNILVIYDDYKQSNPMVNHDVISNKVLNEDVLNGIMIDLGWKKNVMNRYMNELENKGVIVDGKLVKYVCLDSKKDPNLVLSWEVV